MNVEIGTVAAQFLSGIICFEFSVLVLCSVVLLCFFSCVILYALIGRLICQLSPGPLLCPLSYVILHALIGCLIYAILALSLAACSMPLSALSLAA